jgi:hypothetical protein
VAQYLTLTVLRMQIESSMAPMMTPLLTRHGSWQLRSDDFITPPPPTSSSSATAAAGQRSTHPAQICRARGAPSGRLRCARPLDERDRGRVNASSSEKWNGNGGSVGKPPEAWGGQRGGGGGAVRLL